MRTLFAALFLLFATSAFAQYNGQTLSSQPNPWRPAYHEQHAQHQRVQSERSLNSSEGALVAQGDGSMANIKSAPEEPLGDAARRIREEKKVAKKAIVIWER